MGLPSFINYSNGIHLDLTIMEVILITNNNCKLGGMYSKHHIKVNQ